MKEIPPSYSPCDKMNKQNCCTSQDSSLLCTTRYLCVPSFRLPNWFSQIHDHYTFHLYRLHLNVWCLTLHPAAADGTGNEETDETGSDDEDNAEDEDDTCFPAGPIASLAKIVGSVGNCNGGDCCHFGDYGTLESAGARQACKASKCNTREKV